jgi:hypothetical protein
MNIKSSTFIKTYWFSMLLIASIGIGSMLGIILKKEAVFLKPFGDVFLNLLFTAIVPLGGCPRIANSTQKTISINRPENEHIS